jgi:hypothetical protein
MADETDLINNVVDKNPIDFAETLNQLLRQKASDAIRSYRESLAQSIYSDGQSDVEDDDVGDEFSDEELDDLGDEDDDLDLDLEDLDLEDLEDLEDLDLDDDSEDFTDVEDA